MLESICEIPLHDRSGAVVGRARVDEDDWLALARYPWHLTNVGYAAGLMGTEPERRPNGTYLPKPERGAVQMHRLLVELDRGDRRQVDHINRDRLDNRRSNLRVVTIAQQRQNQTAQRGKSSRHRGVTLYKPNGRWRAAVKLDGVRHSLGYFDDEDEAGRIAAAWRREHMPYANEDGS